MRTGSGVQQLARPTKSLLATCEHQPPVSDAMAESSEHAVAIVGIGCKVPGAENIREFWNVLLKGENHIVEIPPSRWNADASYDPDPMAPGKTYVKRAGLVKGWDEFDNKLYGINDFEAPQMDPQQRFVLDCTFMALQDAGLTRAHIAGSNTGVFVGVMNADFRGLFTAQSSNIGNYTVTGISNSIIAARLSYVFDLRGPSLVLDTACSSSLIAIHLGCQAILTGDCDMAICGGVNYLTLPDIFVHLSKARMISPTGQCHSFSDKADGYTRGEGCGIVIIKRLRDAERDGDNIWATICTGSNQDGHAVSPITAPSGLQQRRLMEHVYRKTGLDLSAVDYIEAHGTGTGAGDPVEVNSLGEYFKHTSPRHRYIGSVKTNIGHLESAAGVVSIIKVLLMMKHGKIVPSLHFHQPNPKIQLQEFELTVPTSPVDWTTPHKVACCNSFGFGGSNSHAVVTCYTKRQDERRDVETATHPHRPCIVCFSAVTINSLRGSVNDFCADPDVRDLHVHDVSYTSTARRDHFPLRLALVVDDMQHLLHELHDHVTRWEDPVPVLHKPKVTFVFCGMGTTWPGMCRELLRDVPVFGQTIQQVDRCLAAYVTWSLTERLQQETFFNHPEFSPIAIFACQVALAATWRDLGVEPQSIVGQSVGEVAAAHVAGCLGMEDAVKVVYHRSHLLSQVTGGKMTIVRQVKVEQVRSVLSRHVTTACVSLQYSPTACCISADAQVMEEVKAELLHQLHAHNKSMQFIDLQVPAAYHSHQVEPCKQPLADALQGLHPSPPRVPFFSSVTGEILTTAPDVQYWVDNLRMPVLFDRAVRKSCDPKRKTIFLEIGPKPTLRAHLADIFDKEDVTTVVSMMKHPEYRIFLQAVVDLHLQGVDVTWPNLPTLGTRITEIPRYVFDAKKNLGRSECAAVVLGGVDDSRRCHAYTLPIHKSQNFKILLSPMISRSIYDHVISGKIVVPGAFYAEAGLAIGRQMPGWGCGCGAVAVAVDFEQALSVAKDSFLELDAFLTEATSSGASYRVARDNRLLARLHVTKLADDTSPGEHVSVQYVQSRCPVRVNREVIYSALRSSGFHYGDTFSLLDHAYTNTTECLAVLKVPKEVMEELAGCTIHPCVLDCTLQSCLIITLEEGKGQELLPKAISRLVVHRPMETTMFVHTTLRFRGSRQHIFDLKLLSTSGHVIAELEGLVIKLISEARLSSLPDMFVMEWCPLMSLPPPGGRTSDGHLVVLTDQDVNKMSHDGDQVVVSYAGKNFLNGLTADVQRAVSSAKDAAAIVLLRLRPFHDNSSDEEVNFDIMNCCFLYKGVLSLASQMALSIPIYLCTCRAWPSPDPNTKDSPVNPTCTALWALVRSVVRERIYPQVVAVDLHLPSDKLTSSFLKHVLHVMTTDSSLRNYPELMMDESSVAVNQVVKVDPDTPIPLYRPTSADAKKAVILISREASDVCQPIAMLHDVTASQGEMTIASHTFAIQNVNLLTVKMPYERLKMAKCCHTKGFAVFAVEVVGQALQTTTSTKRRQASERVVACYPLAVGTYVTVPESCVLPVRLLPGYQVGDVSKLLVLYELQAQVQAAGVTILSTRVTSPFAKVLEALLQRRRGGKVAPKVSILQLDQLTTSHVWLEEVVVSLALLDGATMADVASRWRGGERLVVCSALIVPEALSCAYCLLPEVDVRVVDTRMLFQPASLRRLVPEVAKWVKSQGSYMSEVMQALHVTQETEDERTKSKKLTSVSDLLDLLTFRSWQMGQTEVKTDQLQLFRKDALYVVVGGLTGLGWICVEYLAEKGAGYIAIVNRRHPTSQQHSAMAAVSTTFTCQVRAFQADVTSFESSSRALQEMQGTFAGAQLKGVFFGAAVTADKSFLTMDTTSFHTALAPKVRGVWNLHLLTRDLPLDYFVLHSSVASVVGNGGQTNYATGNGFMDGLAHFRRQQGLAAQTINWGALDVGLVEANTSARQALEAQGFLFMTPDEIRDILTPVLMLNWTQCSPSKFDLDKLTQRLVRDGLAALRTRLEKLLVTPGEELHISEDLLLEVQQAKGMEREQRLAVFETYLKLLAARALSVDVQVVTSDASLTELGMDSIVAMTMINQIRRDTSRRVSALTLVTGEPTVVVIAQALDEAEDEGEEVTQDEGVREGVARAEHSSLRAASPIETSLLTHYHLNVVRPVVFHGTIDLVLTEQQRLTSALTSLVSAHAPARTGFKEAAPSRFLMFMHEVQVAPDVRVLAGENNVGDVLERISREFFDLQKTVPVRFIHVQGPTPLLRIVYHKAALDSLTARKLAEDLSAHLGLPGKVRRPSPSAQLPTISAVSQELSRLVGESQEPAVRFWEAVLSRSPPSLSLIQSFARPPADTREVSSVTAIVSQVLATQLREFIALHHLFLLGVLGSCHQLVLHALTGSDAVPLLFPLDLRLVFHAARNDTCSCFNDILLVAFVDSEKTGAGNCSLKKFVLDNAKVIEQHVKHGMVPLGLLEPLASRALKHLHTCTNGISISRLNDSGDDVVNGDVDRRHGGRLTPDKSPLKAKDGVIPGIEVKDTGEVVSLAGGLETDLQIIHDIPRDILHLTLAFQTSVIDRGAAHLVISLLVTVIAFLGKEPGISVRKLCRRLRAMKRELGKSSPPSP